MSQCREDKNIQMLDILRTIMAKKKEGRGLMSSAGLMRYYDSEEKAVLIEPKTVVTIALVAGILYA